jgi:hypothetical protein
MNKLGLSGLVAESSPLFRYFLRKLRKVKKANGQILAANEVHSRASHDPAKDISEQADN